MSVKVTWSPSTYPTIASYNIERASSSGGPYTFLANVVHNLAGANYDAGAGQFFYVDTGGTLSNWYRLVSIDAANNHSVPSAPLEPVSLTPTVTNTVRVDHNYGSPGALRYQTAGGVPVEQALIRVYLKTAFDQGDTDQPLAITMTDANGNWVTPVMLTTGFTYTILFAKQGLYGPDKQEVIV